MKLILGTTQDMREQLLTPAMGTAEDSTFDAQINSLGLTVAGIIEAYCNRSFERTVDAIHIVPANRQHFSLPRCPVETISSWETKDDETTGWETESDVAYRLTESSGHIYLAAPLGDESTLLRVTYTGGFWLESDDDDNSETQPSGSTLVPDGLKAAWLLQCQHIWSKRDKNGNGLFDPEKSAKLEGVELLPVVKTALNPYVRYDIL